MNGNARQLMALVIALFGIIACTPATPSAPAAKPVEKVAWEQVRTGALLIDVRRDDEFAAGHIDGALHIPHDQITDRAAELGDDKSRAVVLYCRSGGRAGVAKGSLEKLGFKQVLNAGGYEALKAAK
ncbi:MAG: rhodanese-like domain-containing protein [Phycisphaerae bacterium]|nr:rhodanese-like domain-containing protein [Phycisphaerae bacterium]